MDGIKSVKSEVFATEELKPCPFCGAMPNLNKYLDTLGRLKWGIICENSNGKCEIEPMTAWYADKDECIEAWNRRVDHDKL